MKISSQRISLDKRNSDITFVTRAFTSIYSEKFQAMHLSKIESVVVNEVLRILREHSLKNVA